MSGPHSAGWLVSGSNSAERLVSGFSLLSVHEDNFIGKGPNFIGSLSIYT